MVHAEMHGKIYVEEDVLMSSAIGLLSLLPDDLFICFLGTARNLERRHLKDLLQRFSRVRSVDYWNTTFPSGIPDVLVELEDESGCQHCVIVIEVKNKSGKSGAAFETEDGRVEDADRDQLARYWNDLVERYPTSAKAVVFLTGHRALPEDDLRSSLRASGNRAMLFWVSWDDVWSLVSDWLNSGRYPERSSEDKILRLLEGYLRFKGYGRFHSWAGLAVAHSGCEPPPIWYRTVYRFAVGCSVSGIGGQYRRRYTWNVSCRIPSGLVVWYGNHG